MNWYTRRATLTGIYNTTELVMLQDTSVDFQDTWAFLDNRIRDVVNMANTAKQVDFALTQVTVPFSIPFPYFLSIQCLRLCITVAYIFLNNFVCGMSNDELSKPLVSNCWLVCVG